MPDAENIDAVITVRFCKGLLQAFLVKGLSQVTAFSGVPVELFQ